jgi:formylglycine-generating enzyme required for sulfatase activity
MIDQNAEKKQKQLRVGVALTCAIASGLACLGAVFLLAVLFVLRVTPKPSSPQFVDMPTDYYWVTIPAGEFQMGSENGDDDEEPVHAVYVDEFEIGKFEVTNDQYSQCVNAGICTGSAFGEADNLYPVTSVSWYDANDFCAWVGGRLPTETEWEMAARGTDQRSFPWGENVSCDKANYSGCGLSGPTPVGSYESGKSPYGVYDMGGNVWEWTSSLYEPYPYDENDGREDLNSSEARVARGGAWEELGYYLRSAGRKMTNSGASTPDIGFRCARGSVDASTAIIFK